MSDFIFKIPELPEDSLLKRRRLNVSRQKDTDHNRDAFYMESRNTSQNLLSRREVEDCFRLQPLRRDIVEDLAEPSTSQFGKVLNDSNKITSFQNSFTNMGNQSCTNLSFIPRSNPFMDANMRGNAVTYPFSNTNQQNTSVFKNRLCRDNPNFSSISFNHPSTISNSNFKNSCANFNKSIGRNQYGYVDHQKYSNINNIKPCSSLCERKSVFNTGFLPQRSGLKKIPINGSVNEISAKFSTYEALSQTSILQKDSMCPLNASQSALENQSMMKSVLQTSVVSMKEQIMNTLENFGHILLRNAPGMEGSFFKVAKEVKSIFENNSMFMNQVIGTNEMMSTLNCTSDANDCNQQNTLHCEYQGFKPSKKPCNILKEIQSVQNKSHKVEFVESFTVEQKKLVESSKDVLDEQLSFNSPPSKTEKCKEVNLRNWCPVAFVEGLAFSGLNDENVEFKTEIIKKRINNRKVLLNNGYFCNLIGKPDPGKKFPSPISTKLKNGLHANWRILKEAIAKFQKESEKDNVKIKNSGIPLVSDSEKSLHSNTPRRSDRNSKSNSLILLQGNDQLDYNSTKTCKSKAESKEGNQNQSKKGKTNDIKRKENKGKTDKSSHPIFKGKKSPIGKKNEGGNEEINSSRILHVTRSGRIVRRPGNLWVGGDLYANTVASESENLNTSLSTQIISESSKGNKESNASQLKRKRDISDKAAIEVKKSKSEKTEDENVEESGTLSTRTRRNKKCKKTSEPRTLNSTLNSETKKSKKNTHNKDTTKPQTNENVDSWVNDFDEGLINISELPSEELEADIKKMKFINMETPPLKILRSHLKILKNCTPVQSPCWILSQHTESGVKKFERVRAQTFKQKIRKESVPKKAKVSVKNRDVDAVVNWISEREVRSPKHCSKVMKYVIPKRRELEDEEEVEDEENSKEI